MAGEFANNPAYPIYGPFFGVMGAAAAIIFSGKLKKNQTFQWNNT